MAKSILETDKKNAIYDLQQLLYELEYSGVINEKVLPDGIFGGETDRAVREVQRINGLEENGVVDRETWDAIANAHRETEYTRKRAEKLSFFPEERGVIKLGDVGDDVFALQLVLSSLAREFSEFLEYELSGRFDEGTETNVKTFQRLNDFEQNGIVDKKTWNTLARYYNGFWSSKK